MLLEGLRPGRITPTELTGAIQGLRDVEGATGIFSVVDDRVVRRTAVVRIRNRALVPVQESPEPQVPLSPVPAPG